MQSEIELIRWMQNFFDKAHRELQISLGQGLAIKEYQVRDTARQALEIAMGILESLSGEYDRFCAMDGVGESLKLIQKRYTEIWKDLPSDECLLKFVNGVGFLAADMGLPAEAESLFDLLALLEPGDVNPLMGLAYTHLFAGSAQKALEVIRDKVLNLAPGNDLGLAYLAMAYSLLNRAEEALAAASAVITAGRNEDAVAMALETQRYLGELADLEKCHIA